jgi:glyoxylase-like metal-dependent hydrolase (beta-lactamase superfamily II)
VFVTHMHPDHVGLAGWLTRKFGVRLWMTQLEYLYCRVMVADTGREAPDDAMPSTAAPAGASGHRDYRARFGNFGKHVHALPDSYHRLSDGDWLRSVPPLAGHRGPRPFARTCLPVLPRAEAADLRRPGAAAHLVQRLGHPTEPDADPMSDWLASLDQAAGPGADDVLVLPAHNECFRGLHTRLEALRRGQATACCGCAARWPNRAARWMSSARCSAAPSEADPPCWAWPPARAWPA